MDRWPNRSFPSKISLMLWLTSLSLLSPTYKIKGPDIFMGTAHDIGSRRCSCHSLTSSILPTVSCRVWISVFHNMLKLLSVVGTWWSVTCIAGLIYFVSYSYFYLVKTFFFTSAIIYCKSCSKALHDNFHPETYR